MQFADVDSAQHIFGPMSVHCYMYATFTHCGGGKNRMHVVRVALLVVIPPSCLLDPCVLLAQPRSPDAI